MADFGFGIVGTGMIAKVIADAIAAASGARLSAVSSRTLAKAQAFISAQQEASAVEGLEALLARDDVEAVYVAAPTSAKEDLTLAAIAAGKHVLVDKPFADAQSVARISQAAVEADLAFMDATHFVHHPRRDVLRAAIPELVGKPRTLHSQFYTSLHDRSNIRFDRQQEPMGVLGDLGWYCMRAIVEYLQPRCPVVLAEAAFQLDRETDSLIQVTGLLGFENHQSASFGVGFDSGTMVSDVMLFGPKGVVTMDDFVMNWTNSFQSQAPDVPTGYTHRRGFMTPKDFAFDETASKTPQQVLMIDNFVALARSGQRQERADYAEAAFTTQHYLDLLWAKIDRP